MIEKWTFTMTNVHDDEATLRSQWTRITSDPLTPEEAAVLPADTEIMVIWSGGNGPHRYRVVIGPNGIRYAGDLRNDNPLDFIGQERFHTRVWLVG